MVGRQFLPGPLLSRARRADVLELVVWSAVLLGCGGEDTPASVATSGGAVGSTGAATATTDPAMPTTGQSGVGSGNTAGATTSVPGSTPSAGSTTEPHTSTTGPGALPDGGQGSSTTGGGGGTTTMPTADASVQPDGMTAGGDPAAPIPSAGCSGGTLAPGETDETVQVGSGSREYVLDVPASYDGSEPFAVLLDFHGGTYDGPRWHDRASNKFPAMAETERFIYVTPTGVGEWWTTTEGADGEDGQFMRALIDELKNTGCVDTRRIYATGCSMGGDMSFFMGCYFSGDIAAIMPMCGSSAFELESECQPERPVSMQFVIGADDTLNCWEPPRTFVGNPCATETLEVFQGLNNCAGEPQDKHDGHCQSYNQCDEGTEVSICEFSGGHTEIYTSPDIDIYQETWDFLSRFYIH